MTFVFRDFSPFLQILPTQIHTHSISNLLLSLCLSALYGPALFRNFSFRCVPPTHCIAFTLSTSLCALQCLEHGLCVKVRLF